MSFNTSQNLIKILLPIISIKQMSESNISKYFAQSFEDFAYRFQLAEGLSQDNRGVIFIGNTRAGKSTLALAMSGAAMKVVYDEGALTFINPSDKAYKDVVRNTHQSVTEKPNFYRSRPGHNQWAIVDMPGHADSSRFRELINFHYIRTMAANLKEVRFLLVVTLQLKNGSYILNEKELQMLDSFRIMFPNCSSCVNIIINRIDNVRQNEKDACACFRDTVARCGKSQLAYYYGSITDNKIYVIERPPYRLGENGEDVHEMPCEAINRKMIAICNNKQAEFLKLGEHDYYSLNIFKEGDNRNNKEFYDKLVNFSKCISDGVTAASKLFKETLLTLFKSIVETGSCKPCEDKLINIFDMFLAKYSIESPQKKQLKPIVFNQEILLESSKILQLLAFITESQFNFQSKEISKEQNRTNLKRAEQYCNKIADNYSSKLLQIIEGSFGRRELYSKVMDFYLYLIRRISECYFIANIMAQKQNALKQESQDANEIGKLHLIFVEFQVISNDIFCQYFQKLTDSMAKLDVPNLFRDFRNDQFESLKKELLDDYKIIEKLGELGYKDKIKFENTIKPQISRKREEIDFYVIVNRDPTSSQQAAEIIEKLLKYYQSTTELPIKLKIVHKLARLLQWQKDYMHAVALYLHLSLNEDVIRLLNLLEPTLKEKRAQVFSEVATGFEENCMFYYAQRCLELAKRYTIDDLDRYIQLEKKILKLNDPKYISPKIAKRLENQKDILNWQKINDEILFLKQKHRINDQNPLKSVFLKSYR